jgi:aspartyl protease
MPTAMPCIAIWDTGAMGTLITPKVIADLGLKPSGQITVQGVGPAGTHSLIQPAHI